MQRVSNFSLSKKENDIIEKMIRKEFAICSDDDICIESFIDVDSFLKSISESLEVDLSCIDVVAERGIEAAEEVRKENNRAHLIVIADLSLSPVQYLKPSIMASSLLLRPITPELVQKNLHEVISRLSNHYDESHKFEYFIIRTQGKSEYVNYDKIYYFEAREKHVYVVTKRNEFGFYSTLDKIEKSLPKNFARCHRSFIVNMDKIERIEFSQNDIFLQDDVCVPVSRSYKNIIRSNSGKVYG